MLNYTEIIDNAKEKINLYHNESRIWNLAKLGEFRVWRKRVAGYLRNISDRLEPIQTHPLNLERVNKCPNKI